MLFREVCPAVREDVTTSIATINKISFMLPVVDCVCEESDSLMVYSPEIFGGLSGIHLHGAKLRTSIEKTQTQMAIEEEQRAKIPTFLKCGDNCVGFKPK